jgi:MFS family permease
MAGAEAGHIALLALAWQLTGSAAMASMVLLASVVGRTVGAPFAGMVGDRCNRRVVIVASEVAVAASLCGMALAQTMWQLALACIAHSLAASTCGAALDAAVGTLVPSRDLARANSTLGVARTTGHMLGPVLGGIAVAAFGARSAFLIDAASSIVAALVVLGIRGRVGGGIARDGSSDEQASDGGVLAGVHAIVDDPVLRLIAVGWSAMCVCFAFVTAAELPLAVQFGVDEPGLGAIVSSWCAGSLVGAWLARRVQVERRGAQVLTANALVCAVVFATTGVVPVFSGVLALMAIGGLSMALAGVVESTIVQQRIDDSIRARVSAAYQGLFSVVWGTNLALAGLLVELTSAGTAYVYAGAWCLVAAVGFAGLARVLRAQLVDTSLRVLIPRHALESELAEGA